MSKLIGIKPKEINKRLMMYMYGEGSSGKTIASISFKNPYLIDTERGAEHSQYREKIEENNGVICSTSEYDTIIGQVQALRFEKHQYNTLVIDSLTTVWLKLLDKNEKILGKAWGAHIGQSNKEMLKLFSLCNELDMNVIFTAHAKKVFKKVENVKNKENEDEYIEDITYHAPDSLNYFCDLGLEIRKSNTTKERIAKVKKTRISTFTEGEEFIFGYNEIINRYNKDIIEKEPENKIGITNEQVTTLKSLLKEYNIPNDKIDAMLNNNLATCIEELEYNYAQKCIDAINKKYKKVN